MGEQNRETTANDSLEDLFDPMVAVDVDDELLDELESGGSTADKARDQTRLAAKRRRAEARIEAMRLREELGDYDFDFDESC